MDRTPKYCRHARESGDLAFVQLSGQRYYPGEYDSPESHQLYTNSS